MKEKSIIELLKIITKDLIAPSFVKKGIGEDAAVLEIGGSYYLITTDLLIEDTHFKQKWISPFALGYKALAVNLSDIAAMGGKPECFIISIGIPKDFSSKDIEDLILEKYYERLRNRELIYICLTCGYKEIRKASNILFVCPKCGSERITVLKKSDEEALGIINKALKGEKLNLKELNKLRSMDAFSRFLRTLKETATITIAGYGIGHKQAMEILKLKLDLKSLLNEIRRRELLFWKNKIFWGTKK